VGGPGSMDRLFSSTSTRREIKCQVCHWSAVVLTAVDCSRQAKLGLSCLRCTGHRGCPTLDRKSYLSPG